MKIYVGLLTVTKSPDGPLVLTDSNGEIPLFILPDSERDSEQIVKEALYNISGISENYYPTFGRPDLFEFWSTTHKDLYIIYNVNFPELFELVNMTYRWTAIQDIPEGNMYNIIRYVYTKR